MRNLMWPEAVAAPVPYERMHLSSFVGVVLGLVETKGLVELMVP